MKAWGLKADFTAQYKSPKWLLLVDLENEPGTKNVCNDKGEIRSFSSLDSIHKYLSPLVNTFKVKF